MFNLSQLTVCLQGEGFLLPLDVDAHCSEALSESRLRFAFIGNAPFIEADSNGTVVGGVNFELFTTLQRAFGFRISFGRERSYGIRNKTTNVFSGMMGKVRTYFSNCHYIFDAL